MNMETENKFEHVDEICIKYSYNQYDCADYSDKLSKLIIELFNTKDINEDIFSNDYSDFLDNDYDRGKFMYWKANCYFLKYEMNDKYFEELTNAIDKYDDGEMRHDLAGYYLKKDNIDKAIESMRDAYSKSRDIESLFDMVSLGISNYEESNQYDGECADNKLLCSHKGKRYINFKDLFDEDNENKWCVFCINDIHDRFIDNRIDYRLLMDDKYNELFEEEENCDDDNFGIVYENICMYALENFDKLKKNVRKLNHKHEEYQEAPNTIFSIIRKIVKSLVSLFVSSDNYIKLNKLNKILKKYDIPYDGLARTLLIEKMLNIMKDCKEDDNIMKKDMIKSTMNGYLEIFKTIHFRDYEQIYSAFIFISKYDADTAYNLLSQILYLSEHGNYFDKKESKKLLKNICSLDVFNYSKNDNTGIEMSVLELIVDFNLYYHENKNKDLLTDIKKIIFGDNLCKYNFSTENNPYIENIEEYNKNFKFYFAIGFENRLINVINDFDFFTNMMFMLNNSELKDYKQDIDNIISLSLNKYEYHIQRIFTNTEIKEMDDVKLNQYINDFVIVANDYGLNIINNHYFKPCGDESIDKIIKLYFSLTSFMNIDNKEDTYAFNAIESSYKDVFEYLSLEYNKKFKKQKLLDTFTKIFIKGISDNFNTINATAAATAQHKLFENNDTNNANNTNIPNRMYHNKEHNISTDCLDSTCKYIDEQINDVIFNIIIFITNEQNYVNALDIYEEVIKTIENIENMENNIIENTCDNYYLDNTEENITLANTINKKYNDKYLVVLKKVKIIMEKDTKIKKFSEIKFFEEKKECDICYSEFEHLIELDCKKLLCKICFFKVYECPFRCEEVLDTPFFSKKRNDDNSENEFGEENSDEDEEEDENEDNNENRRDLDVYVSFDDYYE
jgi:hypothetical protein